MFGCVMFPDASGDTVSASLLTFLRDLDRPPKMNWGAAVLACLYRGLCLACQVGHRMLIGPTALLIHWSYTRFPIGRPKPRVVGWSPEWGEPDEDSCPALLEVFCMLCIVWFLCCHLSSYVLIFGEMGKDERRDNVYFSSFGSPSTSYCSIRTSMEFIECGDV